MFSGQNINKNNRISYFTNLDFPEISGFPLLNPPFGVRDIVWSRELMWSDVFGKTVVWHLQLRGVNLALKKKAAKPAKRNERIFWSSLVLFVAALFPENVYGTQSATLQLCVVFSLKALLCFMIATRFSRKVQQVLIRVTIYFGTDFTQPKKWNP